MQDKAFIPKPIEGRRFVVGDIHGCSLTLQTLVQEQLQLTLQDQLFLLGDYINRGPDSLGVLSFIIDLQKNGYQVFPLRGNHEQMLISELKKHGKDVFLTNYAREKISVSDEQSIWVETLPYYYILDRFYLVHGAINTWAYDPLKDYNYMLWERETDIEDAEDFLAGKQIIHGHSVHRINEIQEAIDSRAICIPLDNGCYKGVGGKGIDLEQGSLCALDIDKWILYIQPNKDYPSQKRSL